MWGAYLNDMQLIPYNDNGIRLLCFANIYTNCAVLLH